jgi:hypothetical protein
MHTIPCSSRKPPKEAHSPTSQTTKSRAGRAIVLRRFAEYHDLQGAFGRRALTERGYQEHPDGTPSIDEDSVFEKLRERSRNDHRKLIDLAAAVVDGLRLLPKQPAAPTSCDLGPERSELRSRTAARSGSTQPGFGHLDRALGRPLSSPAQLSADCWSVQSFNSRSMSLSRSRTSRSASATAASRRWRSSAAV